MSKKSPSPSPNPGWFPKGRSGNPNGRPRASRAARGSSFEVLVERTLTVTDGSGTREIPVEEALQQRTFQDALAGKRMAVNEVVKWILKHEAWLAKHAAKPSWKPIKRLVSPDPDNADAALLLLGIAAPNAGRADWKADRTHLLLEPWAVQAALRRRRGGNRLEEKDREDIRRCTRDPDTIRWPREQDR